MIPYDADPDEDLTADNAYALKDLFSDLGKLRARSVTIMLESTFNGKSEVGDLVKPNEAPILPMEAFAHSLNSANWAVITPSEGREVASWYPEEAHGLMTYFWLRAMSGEASDRQGRVTAETLKGYLQENVSRTAQQLKKRSQTPNVIASRPDLILAPSNR